MLPLLNSLQQDKEYEIDKSYILIFRSTDSKYPISVLSFCANSREEAIEIAKGEDENAKVFFDSLQLQRLKPNYDKDLFYSRDLHKDKNNLEGRLIYFAVMIQQVIEQDTLQTLMINKISKELPLFISLDISIPTEVLCLMTCSNNMEEHLSKLEKYLHTEMPNDDKSFIPRFVANMAFTSFGVEDACVGDDDLLNYILAKKSIPCYIPKSKPTIGGFKPRIVDFKPQA